MGRSDPLPSLTHPLNSPPGQPMTHYAVTSSLHVGGYQYGAGKTSGAQQLLSDATGLSVALPNHVFINLDATNAYGNMSTPFTLQAILQAILTKAPRLAPIVALQWSIGPTTCWVETHPVNGNNTSSMMVYFKANAWLGLNTALAQPRQ